MPLYICGCYRRARNFRKSSYAISIYCWVNTLLICKDNFGENKKLIRGLSKNKVAINAYYLSILQLFNYALPLVTIPYIIRVIGIDNFGLLAYATATCSYFFLLINYGFDLTATNKIAINTDDVQTINRVFCAVMFLKLSLCGLSGLLLVLLLLMVPFLAENWSIYVYCFSAVVAQSIIPIWLYQGISQMGKITKYSVISKLIATAGVFIFVNSKSDFFIIPILTAISFFFVGIISIASAKKELGLVFFLPKKSELIVALKSGFYVFLSRVFVNVYSATNVIILGGVANVSVVGSYSMAEKIARAFSGLFIPVTQALFPHMSKLNESSKQKYSYLFKKVSLCILVVGGVIIATVIYSSDLLVSLVAGEKNPGAAIALCMLSVLIISSPLGALFSQGLVINGLEKQLLLIIALTLLANLALAIPLALSWGLYGLALAVLTTQILHLLMHFTYYKLVR